MHWWPDQETGEATSSRCKKHSLLGKQKLLRAWKLDRTKLKIVVNYWIWTFCQMTLLLIICWVLEVRPCCQVFAGEDLPELNLVSAKSKPTVLYSIFYCITNICGTNGFTVCCHLLVCNHGVLKDMVWDKITKREKTQLHGLLMIVFSLYMYEYYRIDFYVFTPNTEYEHMYICP